MFLWVQDLNFWGAVYPTYFALQYLKASRGNIVVTSSIAGRVPTARMSFYNVSKYTHTNSLISSHQTSYRCTEVIHKLLNQAIQMLKIHVPF
jgi:NADP-dependent 3-hydroxy acid dehydrogenase YdfG